ncbi:hypothetical protein ACVGVM_30135 (plasmid) [Pseudonocardia bannensis]|uniref:Carbon monoxide dehydrogenase subunit G n=1 Tax=Pseudonocardia bannensis TaxID=630973 RepID=A0A848DM20_9PSEU|nr:hypothetical protein [Pseudonocardia bannensis]NMH93768.1 hypothetical protein [Pseudonocardia bannensis]
MTAVHEHPVAAPLAAAWQVLTAAQGRPGLLTRAGEDPPAPRPRVRVTLPAGDGGPPCRGFLHVVDADADRHVATLSFTGAEPRTGAITRLQLRVRLLGTGPRCTLRAQPQVLDAGVPAHPGAGAALAAQIADAIEARSRAGQEQPARPAARTVVAGLAASLLAAVVITRCRRARPGRRRGQEAGEGP